MKNGKQRNFRQYLDYVVTTSVLPDTPQWDGTTWGAVLNRAVDFGRKFIVAGDGIIYKINSVDSVENVSRLMSWGEVESFGMNNKARPIFRASWVRKEMDQYIQYFSPVAHGMEMFSILDGFGPDGKTTLPLLPFLMLKTVDDEFIPYSLTMEDMMANDWIIHGYTMEETRNQILEELFSSGCMIQGVDEGIDESGFTGCTGCCGCDCKDEDEESKDSENEPKVTTDELPEEVLEFINSIGGNNKVKVIKINLDDLKDNSIDGLDVEKIFKKVFGVEEDSEEQEKPEVTKKNEDSVVELDWLGSRKKNQYVSTMFQDFNGCNNWFVCEKINQVAFKLILKKEDSITEDIVQINAWHISFMNFKQFDQQIEKLEDLIFDKYMPLGVKIKLNLPVIENNIRVKNANNNK